jgi:hypothetical protein
VCSGRLRAIDSLGGSCRREPFGLFLTSGVFRQYAERFLRPEQIDAVDIARCLGHPGV